ncbi:unannotated protein [freshwater metagenome]|uniref:Unannotated protein n=1 Tax=freshwater metagenome TaxID=449393 RepID=A0A6J7QUK6_9ZZZZ
MNDHVVCSAARRSLSRAIITYPMPCSNTAIGNSVASAPRARNRVATLAAISIANNATRNGTIVAGIVAFLPNDAST